MLARIAVRMILRASHVRILPPVLSSKVERLERSTNKGILKEGALIVRPWRGCR